MSTYPWSRNDAIENPSTYYYTEFLGPALLAAWWESRRTIFSWGPATEAAIPAPQHIDQIEDGDRIPLELLIEAAFEDATTGRSEERLDLACRRFEVSRRFYEAYSAEPPHRVSGFPPVHEPGPYVRFGEALVARWQRVPDLRDLNALLKLCDLFEALGPSATREERQRMAAVIDAERVAVQSVAERVGVKLP